MTDWKVLKMTNNFGLNDSASEDYQNPNSVSPVRGERALLSAMMGRAICDAFGLAQCEKHLVRNARHWLFSPLTPKRPFSFAWTAHYLDLEPEDILKNLKDLTPEQIAEKINMLRS